MRPHLLNLGVQGRLSDFTLFDINHQAIIGTDIPNIEPLLEFVPLTADHYSVAIPVRLRTGYDRRNYRLGESPDPLEESGNLPVLQLELCGIIDLLVLAASALP